MFAIENKLHQSSIISSINSLLSLLKYYIEYFNCLQRTSPSCLAKSNGSPQCICPAVTGSVTATASHMYFRQKEKIICHGAPWRRTHSGISPLHCHSLSLVDQIISMGVAWRQLGMIRQESKQIISVATAVCVVERFSIGLKSKNLSIDASDIRGKNSCCKQRFWNSLQD